MNKEADFKERLDLIKGERFQRVYSKLYTNTKGKISASFYELKGGRKKLIEDLTDWVGATFTGIQDHWCFFSKKSKDYYIIRKGSTNTQEGRRRRTRDNRK